MLKIRGLGGKVPQTTEQFEKVFRNIEVVPDSGSVGIDELKDGSVTNTKFRDSAGTSIIGRSITETGKPADIQFNSDNLFLVRRGGVLGAGPLLDADIPSNIARDSEVTAAVGAISSFSATITFSASGAGLSGAIVMSSAMPAITWRETDATANNRLWDIVADGESLKLRALVDDGTGTDFGVIDRLNGVIDAVRWSATICHLDGLALFGNSTDPTRLLGKKEHTSAPAATLAAGEFELTLYDNGTTPALRARYNDAGTTKHADLQMSANGGFVLRGTGTPESAVTAAVGTLYLRSDGGAGTTLYVKESGAGNTGWVAK